MEIQLFTADFPWFFLILVAFYIIKFITNEKEKSISKGEPKKIKRPVVPTSANPQRKQDIPKTVFKEHSSTSTEKHKPKMSEEKHGNPMHQEVYKSKDILHYDFAVIDSVDDSLENNADTLTDAMNKGKYTNQDIVDTKSVVKVKLFKKDYSPKEIIILQTILDRKY